VFSSSNAFHKKTPVKNQDSRVLMWANHAPELFIGITYFFLLQLIQMISTKPELCLAAPELKNKK
jgi:hypothetical protein